MKARIHKSVFYLFLFILLSCLSSKELNVPIKYEKQKLLSVEFKIQLPIKFKLQKQNYEEGVVYFYSFIDEGYIIVFEGSMMEFHIDKYPTGEIQVRNDRVVTRGIYNSRYWRKDVFGNIRLYYDNVDAENMEFYEKIMDEIIFRKLEIASLADIKFLIQ